MEQQRQKTLVQQWSYCRLDRCGPVYILTLTGDGDHVFNPSSVEDMLFALTVVEQCADARALITTNEGRFFSNGLDIQWIRSAGVLSATAGLIRDKFEAFLCFIMKLGIPTITAICGHTVGAGLILALAHDYRFMMNGKPILYMPELDNAMVMPRSLMAVIKSKLLPASLRKVMLRPRKITASEAFEFGIVDGFYDDSAKTLEAAIAEAEKLASRNWNKESYAILRALAFPNVIEELEEHRDPYTSAKGVYP